MRVLFILALLAVTSSTLFLSTHIKAQENVEASANSPTPKFFGNPSQPGYQIQAAIYDLAQEIIELDESKSMDDAVKEAVTQIIVNIEAGESNLPAAAVAIIVANKTVAVEFLTQIASLTVVESSDAATTTQPSDTDIAETEQTEADSTETLVAEQTDAEAEETTETVLAAQTDTEAVDTTETVAAVLPETSLLESTKKLVESQPDSVDVVMDLGFALYPESAQDIITGAVLTGEITGGDALTLALSSGVDPNTVSAATAAGGDTSGIGGDTQSTDDAQAADTQVVADATTDTSVTDTAAVDVPATTNDAADVTSTDTATVDAPAQNIAAVTPTPTPTAPVGPGTGAGGSGGGDSTVSGS